MSYGKFASADVDIFLRAREARQAMLSVVLSRKQRSTLFLSLNIPGVEKSPRGSEGLFASMRSQLAHSFSEICAAEEGRDALGPFLLASFDIDAIELKKRCILWETATTAGRLIDLDVYDAQGRQVDRQSLGLSGRPCLVCDQPAVDCMRNKRHATHEVIGKVNDLLAPFVA